MYALRQTSAVAAQSIEQESRDIFSLKNKLRLQEIRLEVNFRVVPRRCSESIAPVHALDTASGSASAQHRHRWKSRSMLTSMQEESSSSTVACEDALPLVVPLSARWPRPKVSTIALSIVFWAEAEAEAISISVMAAEELNRSDLAEPAGGMTPKDCLLKGVPWPRLQKTA